MLQVYKCCQPLCHPSLYTVVVSLWTALKQVRRSADESGVSLKDYGMLSRCALIRINWSLL